MINKGMMDGSVHSLEHVPAKCTHFADKNMLQHIDPGALSYRRNGSISTESALAARLF